MSSVRTLQSATALGVIDEGVTAEEGIARADVVYLAQPILRILDFLPVVAAHLRPHAIVTDAGSTKVAIVKRALELLPERSVVGGHPMAGKEVRGVEEADGNIFEGRPYILTAGASALSNPLTEELIAYIQGMGSRVLFMDAPQHDSTVALISHLCQMTSTALACTVLDGISSTGNLAAAGPALRDMTRVAMSSFELWKDIIETNQAPIEGAIDSLVAHLTEMRNNLGKPNLENDFERGARLAKLVRQPGK